MSDDKKTTQDSFTHSLFASHQNARAADKGRGTDKGLTQSENVAARENTYRESARRTLNRGDVTSDGARGMYDGRSTESKILANQNVEPRAKVRENPFALLGTKQKPKTDGVQSTLTDTESTRGANYATKGNTDRESTHNTLNRGDTDTGHMRENARTKPKLFAQSARANTDAERTTANTERAYSEKTRGAADTKERATFGSFFNTKSRGGAPLSERSFTSEDGFANSGGFTGESGDSFTGRGGFTGESGGSFTGRDGFADDSSFTGKGGEELQQKKADKKARRAKAKKLLRVFVPLTVAVAVFAFITVYTLLQTVAPAPLPLTEQEQTVYNDILSINYGESLTRSLPYPVTDAKLFLYAKSGIVLDFATGCVLFEKNADALIPPASLTKIAVMYEVFDAIKNGETTLDTVVELVPQSWARNAPPQSSLMGLEKGQIVTVHELLLGLSVASGNDAATAIAFHLEDSVEAFCNRLNATMQRLGLVHTRFVDTSGYSELNMTTPREFAALARAYIELYPDALQTYHSAPRFDFPTRKNYPANYTGDVKTRYIYATNKLLSQIEGCDGLKTGFIYESGYNIALTAKRGDTRFITVTMGGPGIGTVEGNKYRIADGKTLLNWAFATFETYPERAPVSVPLKVWEGTETSLFAVEAQSHAITVPKITENAAANIVRTVQTAETLTAPINTGDKLGSVRYMLNGVLLEEVPLIADRSIEQANVFKRAADKIAFRLIKKFSL